MELYKYPRTPHLPFSEGVADDDKRLDSDSHFYSMTEVVVTTKMDGENTTVYPDGTCHARSLDSKHRDYHSWLLRDIQNWCYSIPEGQRICGEYLYAKHSIGYDNLPSYFMCFSVWEGDWCLDWAYTKKLAKELGIQTVPELYKGAYNQDIIKKIAKDGLSNGQEGIVVRNSGMYPMADVAQNIAKYVRPNHVQTDVHWTNSTIIPNGLGDK